MREIFPPSAMMQLAFSGSASTGGTSRLPPSSTMAFSSILDSLPLSLNHDIATKILASLNFSLLAAVETALSEHSRSRFRRTKIESPRLRSCSSLLRLVIVEVEAASTRYKELFFCLLLLLKRKACFLLCRRNRDELSVEREWVGRERSLEGFVVVVPFSSFDFLLVRM